MCEEMKSWEKHKSEERIGEDWQFEDVKITKSED